MRETIAAFDKHREITPPGLDVEMAQHTSYCHNSRFPGMATSKNTPGRKLVAIQFFGVKAKIIVFYYKTARWEYFETFAPRSIREALKVSLKIIDDEFPGALDKAAKLDDKDWQADRKRTRRYVAENPDIIYIDSPHLQGQVENVKGFFLPTNIPWRDVSRILSLVCKAAGIRYGGLSNVYRGIIEPAPPLPSPT